MTLFSGTHDKYYLQYYSQKSLPSASSGPHHPHLSFIRRCWNVISRNRPPADESVPRERPNRSFFTRRAPSNLPLEPATILHSKPIPAWKVKPGDEDEEDEDEDDEKEEDKSVEASNGKDHFATCRAHLHMTLLPILGSTAKNIETSGDG
ncbi:hypothetical protein EDB19DRAFT_1830344 [Suillus lakei]|nr:hypothetical protein EDB19DRAFT_1830344 [Suillus lakei]